MEPSSEADNVSGGERRYKAVERGHESRQHRNGQRQRVRFATVSRDISPW